MNPDSIFEYVRWLTAKHYTLREAVIEHRVNKTEHALPGSIDDFDRTLWSALDSSYEE